MTETEKKALALLNEVCAEMGLDKVSSLELDMPGERALLRAIEQHEAFRQEVSDAVEAVFAGYHDAPIPWVVMRRKLEPFIIAKPDPLVEVIADYKRTKGTGEYATNKDMADALRAALAARGLEIREKQP